MSRAPTLFPSLPTSHSFLLLDNPKQSVVVTKKKDYKKRYVPGARDALHLKPLR